MTEKELRTKARTMNADVLASAIDVDGTELRRWIAGGVNSRMMNKVWEHLDPEGYSVRVERRAPRPAALPKGG